MCASQMQVFHFFVELAAMVMLPLYGLAVLMGLGGASQPPRPLGAFLAIDPSVSRIKILNGARFPQAAPAARVRPAA